MINLESAKVTPRDQQVLNLLVQGCSNKVNRRSTQHQPAYRQATPANAVPARGHTRGP